MQKNFAALMLVSLLSSFAHAQAAEEKISAHPVVLSEITVGESRSIGYDRHVICLQQDVASKPDVKFQSRSTVAVIVPGGPAAESSYGDRVFRCVEKATPPTYVYAGACKGKRVTVGGSFLTMNISAEHVKDGVLTESGVKLANEMCARRGFDAAEIPVDRRYMGLGKWVSDQTLEPFFPVNQ